MQGARIFRNEAYIEVRRMTKDETQRSRWTFYEVVNFTNWIKKKPWVNKLANFYI